MRLAIATCIHTTSSVLCLIYQPSLALIPVLKFTPSIGDLIFPAVPLVCKSAHSRTMAWALIILLNPAQNSFPSFWLCCFSAGHDCLKGSCPLMHPELTLQSTYPPHPLLLCHLGSIYLFFKPGFYVFLFF